MKARAHLIVAIMVLGASSPTLGQNLEPAFHSIEHDVGLGVAHASHAEGRFLIWESVGPGVTLFDYDVDGTADIYLPQGAPPPDSATSRPSTPNRLFRNLGGEFVSPLDRDAYLARPAIVGGDGGYGMAATAGDYDHDGFPDLYLTNWGPNVLLRNNGDGTFADVTESAGGADARWSTAALWSDLDGDGALDLFVANYLAADLANHRSCRYGAQAVLSYCGPSLFDGVADEVLHNEGNGTFTAMGVVAGVARADDGKGMAAAAIDHDNDDDVDIYVANDTRANFLYTNDGEGRFVEDALFWGAGLSADGRPQAGMGIVWEDLDGDLDADLVVTNFQDDYNTFYRREGDLYMDQSAVAGLRGSSLRFVAFGITAFDPDLDGDLDLFVANGHIYDAREQYDERQSFAQPNQLFRNQGHGTFEEISASAGPGLGLVDVSRGAAAADLDGDGDPDLVVVNNGGPLRLLANGDWASAGSAIGRDSRSIRIRLVGRTAPREGYGAVVTCFTPSATQRRHVQSGGSFMSQADTRTIFGLGDAVRATIEVQWPGGAVDRVSDVPGGSDLVLTEGRGLTATRSPRR